MYSLSYCRQVQVKHLGLMSRATGICGGIIGAKNDRFERAKNCPERSVFKPFNHRFGAFYTDKRNRTALPIESLTIIGHLSAHFS
jgi:hypothetical protein